MSFGFEFFEEFLTVEENVIDLLQNNKIVEYGEFYKKSVLSKKSYFSLYSMKQFFHKFLQRPAVMTITPGKFCFFN